jgi:phage terminase large subunit-like protein
MRYYDSPSMLSDRFDRVVASWDLAFKSSRTSAFACGQPWGRADATAMHPVVLDSFAQAASRVFREKLESLEEQATERPHEELQVAAPAAGTPGSYSDPF